MESQIFEVDEKEKLDPFINKKKRLYSLEAPKGKINPLNNFSK